HFAGLSTGGTSYTEGQFTLSSTGNLVPDTSITPAVTPALANDTFTLRTADTANPASTITFANLGSGSKTYAEGLYTLSSTSNLPPFASGSTHAVQASVAGDTFTLTATDGRVFALSSIQLAGSGTATNVTFNGTTLTNQAVSQTFTVPAAGGFRTYFL